MTEDILLIDKPKGITSFDVIRRLRKGLGKKKMGHAGTLDPLASGLMIIGVGDGTKKLNEYIKLPKSYVADILVGEKRSTGDMEGEILEKKKVTTLCSCEQSELENKKCSCGEELKEVDVKNVLKKMIGVLHLRVPVYSAVKIDGKKLYKEARKGNPVTAPIRDMEIKNTQLLGIENGDGCVIVNVEFDVASGVYIRSLAEEFGKRLGYPATIKELRRTRIGDFDIKDAAEV